jgi:eukaryotic-like serine/threonine-protein kinase
MAKGSASREEEAGQGEHIGAGVLLGGQFRVEGTLGEGGMGVVLLATDVASGGKVALKLLTGPARAHETVRASLLTEATATSRLKGEHVARVSNIGALPCGRPFLVMEHLEGTDLGRLLEQRGRLSTGEAAAYVIQACEALSEAHDLGIVHRDLKPSNLFLTRSAGGAPTVKILDFGVARFDGSPAAAANDDQMIGSLPYMAPEQLTSPDSVDGRADIWSLGVALFELIAGGLPFEGVTFEATCVKVMVAAPPSLQAACPSCPAGLEAVIARCLSKDRASRFSSVAELALALAPVASPIVRGSDTVGLNEVRIELEPPASSASGRVRSGVRPSVRPAHQLAGCFRADARDEPPIAETFRSLALVARKR